MSRLLRILALFGLAATFMACSQESRDEAKEAMDEVQDAGSAAVEAAGDVMDDVQEAGAGAMESAGDMAEDIQEAGAAMLEEAEETAESTMDQAKQDAKDMLKQ
jgi:hypothetical protein